MVVGVVLSTAAISGCTATPATTDGSSGSSTMPAPGRGTPSAAGLSSASSTAAASAVSSEAAEAVSGGCGGSSLHRGNPPSWASGKEHGFTGPNQLIYAMSDRGLVVAYLYGHPLAVQDLGSKRDKILWFVQDPGGRLTVEGRLNGSPGKTFSQTVEAAGAGGFPSEVTVPVAGCWHFTLSWSSDNTTQRDNIRLRYLQHR